MTEASQGQPMWGLPRPGKALRGVLVTLLAFWVMFAVGLNWAGADERLFLLFCGNTERFLSGEVWRLITAPLMHHPSGSAGFGHILSALVLLYFLSPNLEKQWGGKRFLRFLVLSSVIAFGLQMAVLGLLPASAVERLEASHLVPGYWYGAIPAGEAVAIAWALSFRGQQVRLLFVLPVTSTGLIVFVIAVSVLRVIAVAETFEGLLAPFGGMFAGWLLGAGTPSPARRLYLRLLLKSAKRRTEAAQRARRERVRRSGLRVIEGGGEEPTDGERGPDGRWLN